MIIFWMLTVNVNHLKGIVRGADSSGNSTKCLPLPNAILLKSVNPARDVSCFGIKIDIVISAISIQTR